jgi:hypothetical protein
MLKRCEKARSSGWEVRLSQPGAQQVRDGTSTVALHLAGRRRWLHMGFPYRLIKLRPEQSGMWQAGKLPSIRSRACGEWCPKKKSPGGGTPGFLKAHFPCATLSYWSDTYQMGTLKCVFKGNESIASRHVWARTAGVASPTRPGILGADARVRYQSAGTRPKSTQRCPAPASSAQDATNIGGVDLPRRSRTHPFPAASATETHEQAL